MNEPLPECWLILCEPRNGDRPYWHHTAPIESLGSALALIDMQRARVDAALRMGVPRMRPVRMIEKVSQ